MQIIGYFSLDKMGFYLLNRTDSSYTRIGNSSYGFNRGADRQAKNARICICPARCERIFERFPFRVVGRRYNKNCTYANNRLFFAG